MKKFFFFIVLFIGFSFRQGKEAYAASDGLVFSNYEGWDIKITISDHTLYLDDFPEEFKYVAISLYGESGKEYSREGWLSTSSTIEYKIDPSYQGRYYLQIYYSNVLYSKYWGYIFENNGVILDCSVDGVSVIQSPTYKNNKSLYEIRRKDKDALQYYLMPSNGVESDNEDIIGLAKDITEGASNDYERAKIIHDWVCRYIWYDYDAYYDEDESRGNSALDTFNNNRAVCQGYASLTAALLRAVGIPAKVVTGYALSYEWSDIDPESMDTNHAWNEAYIDDRWIIIDTTWDSINKYEEGVYSKVTNIEICKYFDPTLELFSYNHMLISNDSEVDQYYKNLANNYLKETKITPTKKTLNHESSSENAIKLNLVIPMEANKLGVNITYKSSNVNIVKVDKNGKITGLKKGNATITTTVKIGKVTKTFKTYIVVR